MDFETLKALLAKKSVRIIGFLLACVILGVVLFMTRLPSKPADNAPINVPTTMAPLAYSKKDENAEVRLILPEAIKNFPILHTKLYNEGEATLKAFAAEAQKNRQDSSASGFEEPAYVYQINWSIAAESERLLSVYAEDYVFTGGAHPNHSYDAFLWDKKTNDMIPQSKLFRADADFTAIDAYLCQQIATERSRRLGEPVLQNDGIFPCPTLTKSRLVLVASTQGGKAATLDALYGPYEVGAYAEGDFQIRLPLSMIAPLLAPDYANQFGGQPQSAPTAIIDKEIEPQKAAE